MSISEREKNMQMAFHLTKPLRAVLLIDDVLTTGLTVDVYVWQLREEGSRRVGVVTLATPKKKKIFR